MSVRTKSRIFTTAESVAVLLFIAIVCAAVSVGCNADPTVRYALARESLTQVEKGTRLANQNHVLPDKDYVVLEPYFKATRGALERAYELMQAGDAPQNKSAIDRYLDLAEEVLHDLEKFYPGK